jgi:hypothetical protein
MMTIGPDIYGSFFHFHTFVIVKKKATVKPPFLNYVLIILR